MVATLNLLGASPQAHNNRIVPKKKHTDHVGVFVLALHIHLFLSYISSACKQRLQQPHYQPAADTESCTHSPIRFTAIVIKQSDRRKQICILSKHDDMKDGLV